MYLVCCDGSNCEDFLKAGNLANFCLDMSLSDLVGYIGFFKIGYIGNVWEPWWQFYHSSSWLSYKCGYVVLLLLMAIAQST